MMGRYSVFKCNKNFQDNIQRGNLNGNKQPYNDKNSRLTKQPKPIAKAGKK